MISNKSHLKHLKIFLQNRIIGQEVALERVFEGVLRGELGLSKKGKPKGSFLFLGSTGVGKTETVLALSEFLYESSERMVRLDMAEFQGIDALKTLLGSTKFDQGRLGDMIDDLNSKGGGIILFDEIEKADKSLMTLFLSALDEARITMANGSVKDLSAFYLIFTSNIGGADASQMRSAMPESIEKHFIREAENYFRPELYARFSKKIVFNALSYEVQLEICRKLLYQEVEHIGAELGLKLVLDDKVFPYLVEKGYSALLGARPMKTTIEEELAKVVTQWVLNNDHEQEMLRLRIAVENHRLIIKEIFDEKRCAWLQGSNDHIDVLSE